MLDKFKTIANAFELMGFKPIQNGPANFVLKRQEGKWEYRVQIPVLNSSFSMERRNTENDKVERLVHLQIPTDDGAE